MAPSTLSSNSNLSVSAVIVSHNEGARLRRTIDAMMGTLPRDAEVVVVDDASTDGSADYLHAGYGRVTVIHTTERLGVARARNQGASVAKGRALVFSDAHVEVDFGWLGPLLETLAKRGVGAVGPAIAVLGNPAAKGYGYTLTDASMNTRWLGWPGAAPSAVPMLCGCFFAIRPRLFRSVGGFDPGFEGWGAEDTELSMRLWLLGYECRVVPSVHVSHLFREHFPYDFDFVTALQNNLRTAFIHFGRPRLERVIARLGADQSFPTAMARVLDSDAWERRKLLQASRKHDDEWFFDRFDISMN